MRSSLQILAVLAVLTPALGQAQDNVNSCIMDCGMDHLARGGVTGCIKSPDGGLTCLCSKTGDGPSDKESKARLADCYRDCISDSSLSHSDVFDASCDEFFNNKGSDKASNTNGPPESESPAAESEGPNSQNAAARHETPRLLTAGALLASLFALA